MRFIPVLTLHLLLVTSGHSQERRPIIDMHLHAMPVAGFANLLSGPPVPHCVPMTDYPIPEPGRAWMEIFQMADPPCAAIWSPRTDDEALAATLEIMRRRNVMAAVTSGPLVHRWREAAPDLVIPSLLFGPASDAPSVDSLRTWFTRGDFSVLGEVTEGQVWPALPETAVELAALDHTECELRQSGFVVTYLSRIWGCG